MASSNRSSSRTSTPMLSTDPKSQDSLLCVVCEISFDRKILEGHISSEHLDYYPYSCGHCGHFMPTEENVIFHAEKKNHIPLKIRENLNKTKEHKLQEILNQCLSPSSCDASTPISVPAQPHKVESTSHNQPEPKFEDPLGRPDPAHLCDSVFEFSPIVLSGRAEAACITVAKNLKSISKTPPKRIRAKASDHPKPVSKKLQVEAPKQKGSHCQLNCPTAPSLPDKQRHHLTNDAKNEPSCLTPVVNPTLENKPVSKGNDSPKPYNFTVSERSGLKLVFTAKPEVSESPEPADPKPSKQPEICPSPTICAENSLPQSKISHPSPANSAPKQVLQTKDVVAEPEPIVAQTNVHPPAATVVAPESSAKLAKSDAADQVPEIVLDEESPMQYSVDIEKPLESILTRVSSDSESPICLSDQLSHTPPPLHPISPPKNPIIELLESKLPTMDGVDTSSLQPSRPKTISPSVFTQASTLEPPRAPSVPVAKLKRGIEQIANQLAASTATALQPQAPATKQPRMTSNPCLGSMEKTISSASRMQPSTIVVHQNKEKPRMSISPHWQRSHCKVCAQYVAVSEIGMHVRRHVETRPMYGCHYCGFKGRTPNSVRVHITWKHANLCARAGAGVKDISNVGGTDAEMLAICFPNFTADEVEKYAQDTPISSHDDSQLPVFTNPAESFVEQNDASPPMPLRLPTEAAPPEIGSAKYSGSTISRTATMPSGRVYRYMNCTVCGAEVIDALASSHIYQTHINRRDAIQCGYCEYGVPYAIAEVKRHVQAKHPYLPQKIVDRRPEMQEEYMAWRLRCFPDIGTRQPQKASGSDGTSSGKQGTTNTPTMVDLCSPSSDHHLNSGYRTASDMHDPNVLIGLLKRPPLQINAEPETMSIPKRPAINLNTGTVVSAHQKYWSQAHVRNSRKTKCFKCQEEITHLWANRHIWRHLEEQKMSRYKCGAPGCEYQTYLMRSLDTHCNYHGKGLTAEIVGYDDRADAMRDDWVKCWKDCFRDEEIPMNCDSPHSVNESTVGSIFTAASMGSNESKLAASDDALNLLMVAAHGQNQINSTIRHASNTTLSANIISNGNSIGAQKLSPPHQAPASSSIHMVSRNSSLSPNELRLPVIRSSLNGLVTVPSCTVSSSISVTQDAWCEKCCCSVAAKEVEDHIWFAHLGGILPYRCGRCQRSFMSEQLVRDHWDLEHYHGPSAGAFNNSMEIIKNQHAKTRFQNQLVECFPDIFEASTQSQNNGMI